MKNNIFPFLSTALVACNGLGTKHVYASSPAELMQEVPAVATCNLQLATRQNESVSNNKVVRESEVSRVGLNFYENNLHSQFYKNPGMSPKQYGIYLMRTGKFTRNRLKRKMLG